MKKTFAVFLMVLLDCEFSRAFLNIKFNKRLFLSKYSIYLNKQVC